MTQFELFVRNNMEQKNETWKDVENYFAADWINLAEQFQLNKQVGVWVKASERLPDPNKLVAFKSQNMIFTGWYYEDYVHEPDRNKIYQNVFSDVQNGVFNLEDVEWLDEQSTPTISFSEDGWNKFKERIGELNYEGLINTNDLIKVLGDFEGNNISLQKDVAGSWISTSDKPLVSYCSGQDYEGEMHTLWQVNEGIPSEFLAAVYVINKVGENFWWIRHCTIEDERGLCIVGDDLENIPAGWEIESVEYWQPLPKPPSAALQQKSVDKK